jgi:hypothetical protein
MLRRGSRTTWTDIEQVFDTGRVSEQEHQDAEQPSRDYGSIGYSVEQQLRMHQNVVNESWPPPAVAREVRDVARERQVDVTVRLVFERDGEQQVPGRAVRWWKRHVCVSVNDRRLQVGYVWLDAGDVQRN